jgi:hypothetical protein
MRVIICGDRYWTDEGMIDAFVRTLAPGTIVIEGEQRGADLIARVCAERAGLKVEPYPADWDRYGLPAGPIRNGQMLTYGNPDEVHAFHDHYARSRGTKNMITQAKRRGVPCYLHTHGGVWRP